MNSTSTRQLLSLPFLAFAICNALPVAAVEWGDLKMRFVVDGTVPMPEPRRTGKDEAICGKHAMPAAPIVGEKGELENVVVFLVPEDITKLSIHDDYKRNLRPKVEMTIEACAFKPHIAFVQVGQSLVITNGDRIGHVASVQLRKNRSWSPIIPSSNVQVFDKEELSLPEKSVVNVVCHIHPWMVAYLLVQNHPYMAASNAKGEVLLKNIPVGKHRFHIWYESIGDLTEKNTVDRNNKPVAWNKGKVEIEIGTGENDLGEYKLRLKTQDQSK